MAEQNKDRKIISSRLTFVYKFIVPAFNVLTVGGVGVIILTMRHETLGIHIILLVAIILVLMTSFVYFSIKKIELDDDVLYISNFHETISVHRSNIEAVTQNVLFNPEVVKIKFKNGTIFGDSIRFTPKYRYFAFFSKHPIVEELQKGFPNR